MLRHLALSFGLAGMVLWGCAARADEITMVTDIPLNHPRIPYFDALSQDVKRLTGGRLAPRVGSDLKYSGRAGFDALNRGEVQLLWVNASHMEAIDPRLAVLNLPFFLNDEALRLPQKGRAIVDFLDRISITKGLRVLGLMRGADQLFALRSDNVHSLADLRGMRVRVAGPGIYEDILKRLGAEPVVMAVPQLKAAFESRELDAVFTSPGGWSSQLGMAAPHAVHVPGLMMITYTLVAADGWYSALSTDNRAAIRSAADAVVTDRWAAMDADDQLILAGMVAQGAHILRINPAVDWREHVAPLQANFAASHSETFARFTASLGMPVPAGSIVIL